MAAGAVVFAAGFVVVAAALAVVATGLAAVAAGFAAAVAGGCWLTGTASGSDLMSNVVAVLACAGGAAAGAPAAFVCGTTAGGRASMAAEDRTVTGGVSGAVATGVTTTVGGSVLGGDVTIGLMTATFSRPVVFTLVVFSPEKTRKIGTKSAKKPTRTTSRPPNGWRCNRVCGRRREYS